MYPSHRLNVWVEIHKSLLSFNGVRSYFLTDEDLSVRLILGDRCFHKYLLQKELTELMLLVQVSATKTFNFKCAIHNNSG